MRVGGGIFSNKCGWVEAVKFFIVGAGSDTQKFKMVGGGAIENKTKWWVGSLLQNLKWCVAPPRLKKVVHPPHRVIAGITLSIN